MPTKQPVTVDLSPIQLAELLDVEPEDAPYLATAPVRLTAQWVADWRQKMGVRELVTKDVAMLLSVSCQSLQRYMRDGANPRLNSRLVGTGNNSRRIAPADLVRFLRERNDAKCNVPLLIETPRQYNLRAEADMKDALAACRGE